MIEIRNISKSFEDSKAVDNVSVCIKENTVFGLIGTNGAGKSTVLRMVAGILEPDEGEIAIDGLPVFDNPEAKASLVNFVLEHMPEKYIVAASGMAGMGSGNEIKTRKISKRFYICGDGKSDVSDGIGLVASRVMICAAHQAHMVIRILTEEFEV